VTDFISQNKDEATIYRTKIAILQNFDLDRLLMNLRQQLMNAQNNIEPIQTIQNASNRIKDGGFLSSRELSLIQNILNPSAGAFNLASINIMRRKLERLKYKAQRISPVSTVGMCFPTFKLYIIEEDAKELLFSNDFYDYAAVKSLKIHESRKDATSTAHILLSNIYGRLTNIIAGKRINVENPFYVRAEDEEEVNAMMLRVGARIQVRLGYNAYLGAESVVFSGRIQQVQGTTEVEIVAQSDGVELTREIGIGTGTDFGGILSRLQNPFGRRQAGFAQTNNALGLITAILDAPKTTLRGLGTFSPYVGSSRIRNVTSDNISGVTTDNTQYGLLGIISQFVRKESIDKILGINAKLIDTRLTNINLTSSKLSNNFFDTAFGYSRWLIYNETVWDSLQDYVLQLGNMICTVRPFDEENSIVIDSDDGIYQISAENAINTYPLINAVRQIGQEESSACSSIKYLSDLLQKEQTAYQNQTISTEILKPFVENMLARTAAMLPSIIDATKIDEAIASIIKKVLSSSEAHLLYNEQSLASRIDNASYETLEDINKILLEAHTKQQAAFVRALPKNLTTTIEEIKTSLDEALLAFTAKDILKTLRLELSTSSTAFRPVSDIHIKTAYKDIIKNSIRVVAGYNRVEMSYLDQDILGAGIQTIAMGTGLDAIANLVGFGRAISLDNINKPSAHAVHTVSVSSTLRPDRYMTYGTTQKNAAIRGNITIDRPAIAANGILANLVRDYYDGELIILMDPTIKPYDICFIHDDINDMWGMIQVKSVTHSFDPMTGAVTVIVPDMYVSLNIDGARTTYNLFSAKGRARLFAAGASLITQLGGLLLGGAIAKLGASALFGVAKRFGKILPTSIQSNLFKNIFKTSFGKTTKKAANILENQFKRFNAKNLSKIKIDLPDDIENRLIKQGISAASGKITKDNQVVLDVMASSLENLSTIQNPSAATTATIKAIKESLPEVINKSGPIGLDDALLAIQKRTGPGQIPDDQIDDVLDNLADSIVHGNSALMKNSVVADVLEKKYIDSLIGLGANAKLLTNPFSLNAIRAVVALGLTSKIGRSFFPNLTAFSGYVGEYLNQRPISISGLIQKGEPMVANLDGMRKEEFNTFKDWMAYKITESFNPLKETIGDLDEVSHTTNRNISKQLQ